MSNNEFLNQFCDSESVFRRWTRTPFRVGEFAYGTNGAIIVRAPAEDEPAPADDAPKSLGDTLTAIFIDIEKADQQSFAPPPAAVFPPPVKPHKIHCDECHGNGRSYGETREDCDGTGFVDARTRQSARVQGVHMDAHWLRIVFALPGVKIAIAHGDRLLFTFDGGQGAFMGCRFSLEKDLGDIEFLVPEVSA